ncbi:Flp family type IVb pilin [Halomonas sp. SL1]|uniref:Flp family type IVb pilin n=1 Tax=Halomonas sp. SL1 TaxID=2137478 RepID=UPI000D1605A5|nr:Flp family type IVb pilin [Halomonas sp. SL1]RAH37355.1 Flp family type IVb pilin [Halomonas sp. SL1]
MKRFSLSQVFAKAHAHLACRQLNRPVFRRQRGATAIEYALIAALVAIAIGVVFAVSDGTDGSENGGFLGMIETLFGKVEEAVE